MILKQLLNLEQIKLLRIVKLFSLWVTSKLLLIKNIRLRWSRVQLSWRKAPPRIMITENLVTVPFLLALFYTQHG